MCSDDKEPRNSLLCTVKEIPLKRCANRVEEMPLWISQRTRELFIHFLCHTLHGIALRIVVAAVNRAILSSRITLQLRQKETTLQAACSISD